MSYELEQFPAECRALLSHDPGPGGREQVRQRLERLLHNQEFVRRSCIDAPKGLHLLYEDGELGFQVLAHLNEKPRAGAPTTTASPGRFTGRPAAPPT